MIQLDEAKIVLAGGMEAMSQAPFVIRGRDGFTLAPGGKLEDSLMVALLDSYCGLYMANTAELYGEQQGITRQAQDEFALRSQQNAPMRLIKKDEFRKSWFRCRCGNRRARRRENR
jgi:acetyl-CoA C-acetyltransferase